MAGISQWEFQLLEGYWNGIPVGYSRLCRAGGLGVFFYISYYFYAEVYCLRKRCFFDKILEILEDVGIVFFFFWETTLNALELETHLRFCTESGF